MGHNCIEIFTLSNNHLLFYSDTFKWLIHNGAPNDWIIRYCVYLFESNELSVLNEGMWIDKLCENAKGKIALNSNLPPNDGPQPQPFGEKGVGFYY